jgi:Lysyl oxidase
MKDSTVRLRYTAAAVSALTAATLALTGATPAAAQGAAGSQAAATATAAPRIGLVAAQRRITVEKYGKYVYLDPGIYVASFGSALQFDVQRASYTKPVTIEQVIHLPGGGKVIRKLPNRDARMFLGLRDFIHMRVVNFRGTTVLFQRITFCPDSYAPQRATPNSAETSPFPQQCGSFDPFPLGDVWGIARGWAVDPFTNIFPRSKLRLGRYTVTETVTRQYRRLFHISARGARATVRIKIVKGDGGPVPGPKRPAAKPLPSLPRSVPYLRHVPLSVRPDLVPLPAWSVDTFHVRKTKHHFGSDQLQFGATVWIGGHSPLDVEGFRVKGSPKMRAYQYFWRDGHIVGRTRVGTMGFAGYNHWHFKQFAEYRLLKANRKLAVRSHKEGFCIAPSDSVDLTLPHALWQPSQIGLGGACGEETALWVQEELPIGWGDTYFQYIPGQSFNISHLPNGVYYIEVIANPEHLLYETNTHNDVTMRKVILGGTPGHRTVRVPPWHGLDPEGYHHH